VNGEGGRGGGRGGGREGGREIHCTPTNHKIIAPSIRMNSGADLI